MRSRAPAQFAAPAAPWSRRDWLRAASSSLALGAPPWLIVNPAHALPQRPLQFPRDHGSHPELRTEWWYITGQVRAEQRLYGFQVTFFRSRVDGTQSMQSEFAARQLIFAHAAVTDVQGQRQFHDQRIARAGFGIADASTTDAAIRLRDWSLTRRDLPSTTAAFALSQFRTQVVASDFSLDLTMTGTQPPILQGAQGLSRKGPLPEQASYYYSEPQLAVSGALTIQGQRMAVSAEPAPSNRAWMDHEWSESLMHPEAVGWDWIGMNLENGGALTVFRLRRADGSAVWAGGSYREKPTDPPQVFAADQVQFTPTRLWTSADSGAKYPVQWRIQTPAGTFTVRALLDAQELDSRGSTGAIYWEGLSELQNAQGQTVGHGYLEMTGYATRLKL